MKKGFTFIELMVVMVLMGIMISLVAPQFGSMFRSEIEKEYQLLTRIVHAIRTEAILGNTSFYLVFDPKGQHLHIEKVEKGTAKREELELKWLKPACEPPNEAKHCFSEELRLENVSLSQNQPSFLAFGDKKKVDIEIDSSGFVRPFVVWFSDSEGEWKIQSKGVMGKLEMIPPNDQSL